MRKSLKSIAINYGLYLGITLALLTILVYAFSLELFVNPLYIISVMIATIIFGLISIINCKKFFNGYINFKEAFKTYFIVAIIGLGINTLVTFVLFNVIDTEASETIKEKTIEKFIEMLKGMNTSEQEISNTIGKIKNENLYSFSNLLQRLIMNYLLPITIIGLISAAFIKKTNPDSE
ncbi:DUF4199 domain-containing protein [uncultured Algibacter sp.]|uniref:DUF4199 domain-containing protein n=1 Tax=uncultured Algibacter sp. TaxID=298659 RepID=UPI00260F4CD9|nr:DUF4199 domain-containing protein [uncultured Algibacter sp.]